MEQMKQRIRNELPQPMRSIATESILITRLPLLPQTLKSNTEDVKNYSHAAVDLALRYLIQTESRTKNRFCKRYLYVGSEVFWMFLAELASIIAVIQNSERLIDLSRILSKSEKC